MNTKDKLQVVELFGNESGIEDTRTFEEKMKFVEILVEEWIKSCLPTNKSYNDPNWQELQ